MAANLSPFISTFLLVALVAIGFKRKLLQVYPMFYSYLTAVVLSDAARFISISFYNTYYLPVYWYTQFFCVAFGFGIVWEMYGVIFRDFPGAARMAKFLVSFALLTVLLNTLIHVIAFESSGLSSVINLEKNMRLVQAALLAMGIALVLYYEIPLGLNAAGILYGYGAFVITGIVLLTLREHFGTAFYTWWASGQSFSYPAMLAIWLFTLHSYRPAPAGIASPAIVEDYYELAKNTRTSLAKIRRSLGKALQP